MPSINLDVGGGFVEISALAALFGDTTAESLILGSRGAAGLPLAAMSTFGSPFLIKACIAAFGLRSRVERSIEAGATQGGIAGISVTLSKKTPSGKGLPDATSMPLSTQYVYAFDGYTSAILRNCPSAEHGTPARIVHYVRGRQWAASRRQQNILDWLSICASLLKLAEAFAIWQYGSFILALLTMINWAWFFLSAILLQLAGLAREHSKYFDASEEKKIAKGYCYDYLAGDLPSVQFVAQHRKIMLSVPPNVREHIGWRMTWAFGALICTGTLVATYIFIGAQPKTATYVWLGFQVLWLVVRSVFFHIAQETDSIQQGVPKLVRERELRKYGFRILSLASGVSQYQTLLHPRMPYCYTEDIHDPIAIYRLVKTSEHLFNKTQIALNVRLEKFHGGQVTTDVEIKAVIGDTLLSSIAWLLGSPYTSMDLYDCCLVALEVGSRTVMIPSARVLSGHVKEVRQPRVDPEAGIVGEHTPRGAVNDGVDIGWVFWVPLDPDRWLYFVGDLNFIGRQRMEVLSSADVTKRLSMADLFVSLRDVRDVEEAVKKSRVVGRLLVDLLQEDDGTVFVQDMPPPYRQPPFPAGS
ncbi:hypothetical protein DL766_009920 [Monosporascus sp. MC13-8B]|uniref:Uncharacterized protein n=1 Tax=Monosporascus cannonballus TaxID=155416 RepID=A0ABY0HKR7_9PEZI|nr:hypothetical protein DL762_001338 [Monosporascus cannonballus]RYP00385.1 hypothetical protein DL763_000851 [Monosporascus cannonballus]RYP12763.1 hypothetical protein DL766_009920 [Monosporascus sp. MC13-8B]